MKKLPRTSAAKKRTFLAAYRTCGNVTRAAQSVGMCRDNHAHWMKRSKKYREDFAAAQEEANDCLEEEARRRAVVGLRRLKFTKDGTPIIDPETGKQYFEHEFSDTLLIFLLKGAMPDRYRERQSIEVSRAEDGNRLRVLEDDEWYGNAVNDGASSPGSLPAPADVPPTADSAQPGPV